MTKEERKTYIRGHYQANKQYYKDKAKKRDRALKQKIRDIKESSPCLDCSNYFPYYVMDFDHLENKLGNVSSMLARGLAEAKIMAEVGKCDLICSNCHRIRTHNRRASVVQRKEQDVSTVKV